VSIAGEARRIRASIARVYTTLKWVTAERMKGHIRKAGLGVPVESFCKSTWIHMYVADSGPAVDPAQQKNTTPWIVADHGCMGHYISTITRQPLVK